MKTIPPEVLTYWKKIAVSTDVEGLKRQRVYLVNETPIFRRAGNAEWLSVAGQTIGRIDRRLREIAADRGKTAPPPIYRAGTIRRSRRTQAAVDQLETQILEVLAADHPQSSRHIFYRMTDPRLPEPVEKSERGYRHVQDRVVKLRRAGRLPYSWITDATRRGYFTPTYRGASEFLRSVTGLYRADLWQRSPWLVEVWTESRSIAGVIQDDCKELAVSLYPAGGFTSITLAFQAAEYINETADGRQVCILYLGDWDPAGVLIDVAIERELRAHLDPTVTLDFRRMAITENQIAEFDLPEKPRKASDRRARHITSTVEAEAMPAHILRAMLREQIEQFLPADALRVAKAAEQSERKLIGGLATMIDNGDAA